MLAVKSFPNGSSGGVDGLRPPHLQDMLEGADPGPLGDTILKFISLLVAGGVPESVHPFFFGGRRLHFPSRGAGFVLLSSG